MFPVDFVNGKSVVDMLGDKTPVTSMEVRCTLSIVSSAGTSILRVQPKNRPTGMVKLILIEVN